MVAIANPLRLAERLGDIVTMYGKLLGKARQTTRSRLREDAGSRLAYVPPYLRGIATSIYTGQLVSDKTQLRRLVNKSPSLNDETILAEATCLSEAYNRSNPTDMYLASTDLLFAPMLNEDGSVKSEVITTEIKQKFGVKCDWPHRIAQYLESVLPHNPV